MNVIYTMSYILNILYILYISFVSVHFCNFKFPINLAVNLAMIVVNYKQLL